MDQAQQLRNIVKANSPTSNRPLARVITVTSGKGGVGKSNTAINLAIQFRKMGQRVIILSISFRIWQSLMQLQTLSLSIRVRVFPMRYWNFWLQAERFCL